MQCCKKSSTEPHAPSPPLSHSLVGQTGSTTCAGQRGFMRSQLAWNCSHVAYARSYLFQLESLQDAVWQQEASARVDHAHMMRDRIMPDQIHNFAHNNEWMIRNLNKIGRVNDAISLASNMAQLPRHPKFNTLKSGSAKYGRERLLQTLSNYRLWKEMLDAIGSGLIETGDDAADQVETLRHTGIAQVMMYQADEAVKTLQELKNRLQKS